MGQNRKLEALLLGGGAAGDASEDRLDPEDGLLWAQGPKWMSNSANLAVLRTGAPAWALRRTSAGAESYVCALCVEDLVRLSEVKGLRLIDAVIHYEIGVVAATSVDVTLNRVTYANGSAPSAASFGGTLTFDANHDTAAERAAVGAHLLTATLEVSAFQNTDYASLQLEIAFAIPNTCVFTLYGGGFHTAHDYS